MEDIIEIKCCNAAHGIHWHGMCCVLCVVCFVCVLCVCVVCCVLCVVGEEGVCVLYHLSALHAAVVYHTLRTHAIHST
jgi:hypothetical protein